MYIFQQKQEHVYLVVQNILIYTIFVLLFDVKICNTIKGSHENVITVDVVVPNNMITIVNDTSQLSVYKYFKYLTDEPKQYKWDSTVK